jgi:predicted tellurium resistance membrane protein TerC
MAKFRWFIFALGVLGLIETPTLILRLSSETDRRVLLTTLVIALGIRLGLICVCFWLWWKFRPQVTSHSN